MNEALLDGIDRLGLGEGLCWRTEVLLECCFSFSSRWVITELLLFVSLNYWICCPLV